MKAVIFDCFGVLYGGSLFTLLNMAAPEKRNEVVDLNRQNDYGFLSFQDYTVGMAELLGKTTDEISAIFKQKRVRNQPLFDFIHELRTPDVKVGLLTNAGRDMPSVLFSGQELNGGLFDAYIVSSENGIVKPNPEIYKILADKLGVPAGDCLMLDDAFENCHGAEAAGMQSVWYADNETAKQHIREFIAHHA